MNNIIINASNGINASISILNNNPPINYSIIESIANNAVSTLTSANTAFIDPYWFYSAAAQSAAAIVGLMGAFLTTKIISIHSQKKQLKQNISTYKNQIEFIEKEIKPFQEWIKKIDEDEERKNVIKFLDEIKETINLDNPPEFESILKEARESEDFKDISEEILKEEYNEEFFNSVRNYRRTPPFARGLSNLFTSNLDATRDKWNRYREYSDYIDKKLVEVESLKKLISIKEDEIKSLVTLKELRDNIFSLIIFSILGVVVPLTLLMLNYETMLKWRLIVLALFIFGLSLVVVTISNEIRKIFSSKY
ncbi:hypothetical protein HYV80_04635 [Candidatus Woesearchaeota archaeon]|nr:hypothetical protein [Candidatus Woesearchaeota archaeon]